MKNALNDDYKKLYNVLTNQEVWSDMKDWWLTNGECEDLYVLLLTLQNSITSKEFLKEYHQAKINEHTALLNLHLHLNLKENENERISDN